MNNSKSSGSLHVRNQQLRAAERQDWNFTDSAGRATLRSVAIRDRPGRFAFDPFLTIDVQSPAVPARMSCDPARKDAVSRNA